MSHVPAALSSVSAVGRAGGEWRLQGATWAEKGETTMRIIGVISENAPMLAGVMLKGP